MKKNILLVLSFVLVALLSVGATLALLTYQDSDHNTMTVGQAKIEQLEYQRVVDSNGNWVASDTKDKYGYYPDKLEEFKQDELLLPTTGETVWDDRVPGHQQSWIEVGSTGSDQLFDDSVTNVKDKVVMVKNTGDVDVYFRTIILIETPEGTSDGQYEGIGAVATGSSKYDWDTTKDGSQPFKDKKVYGTITVNGTRYTMFCAQYTDKLAKDVIARPSLLQVYMRKHITNEQIALYGEKVDVIVLSQAVQAKGYADATTALNDAFGALSENNHPWLPQN